MNPDSPTIDAVRAALLRWYDDSARELPWRGSDDPYAIWVSEIMCQQTRVETVRAYYLRWMQRYPTVQVLAQATEDDVMASWAGLGYYRRARTLHRGAQEVVARHGGEVPSTFEQLRELPGVGDYTAGAIASIAFEVAVPAVDGNATRVMSRLFAIEGDPARAAFRNTIRQHAASLVDATRPGDFNQSVMELGATVCVPRSPRCEECPVAEFCAARASDAVDRFPPATRRTQPRPQTSEAVVILDSDRVWVEKKKGTGLLGGTWIFPTFDEGALPSGLRADFVGSFEHVFSHIRMTYRVHTCSASSSHPGSRKGRWVALDELDQLGISTAMRRVAAMAFEVTPSEWQV